MNLDSVLTGIEKEKKTQNILTAAYLKILVNFMQIITAISNLNIKFKSSFYSFVASQKTVSGSIFNVISLDCLLQGKKLIKFTFLIFYLNQIGTKFLHFI